MGPCPLGLRGHLDLSEPCCDRCYQALRAERRHVNPEAQRRAEDERSYGRVVHLRSVELDWRAAS